MILKKITNDPKQEINYILSTGENIKIILEYKIRLFTWFCTIEYKNFKHTSFRLVLGENLLNQFSNILPFKLKSGTNTKFRAFMLDDFTNGNNYLEIIENV